MPKLVNHEVRRFEISATAASLIATGGLEAATIREIAQSSGYSKGVVEHYFDGKDELISGALEWANHCYEERVSTATAGLEGVASLHQRIIATMPLSKAMRDEWKVRLVFWSMSAINNALRRRQTQRFDRAVVFFESDIQIGISRCEIPAVEDVSLLARHLVNMTTGIAIAALHNRSLYTRAFLLREAECLLAQVCAGSDKNGFKRAL